MQLSLNVQRQQNSNVRFLFISPAKKVTQTAATRPDSQTFVYYQDKVVGLSAYPFQMPRHIQADTSHLRSPN